VNRPKGRFSKIKGRLGRTTEAPFLFAITALVPAIAPWS
jgi:hypothetical protein